MATKYAAFGIALKRVATEIANVTNIAGPELSLDVEDVTTHDQATAWEEVVPTILRSGEVTLDLVFDPTEATHRDAGGGLLDDMDSRNLTAYVLVFPEASEWSFNCYVTGFTPTGAVGGALTATAKLKISGAPTLV